MRLTFVLAVLLTASATSAAPRAPDFERTDTAGRTWRLTSLRGEPVVIYFWQSTCEPCVEGLLALQSLAARHPAARVLTVNDDSERTFQAFVSGSSKLAPSWPRGRAVALPVLRDLNDVIFHLYRLLVVPTVVVVDRGGGLATKRLGFTVEDRARIESVLRGFEHPR